MSTELKVQDNKPEFIKLGIYATPHTITSIYGPKVNTRAVKDMESQFIEDREVETKDFMELLKSINEYNSQEIEKARSLPEGTVIYLKTIRKH